MFFAALSSTTYPSISLEGNHVWLTASLPVRSETIYKAKIIMNLCLTVPAILISSVLLSIRFRPDLLYAVLTVVISVLCSIFMAVFGLTVNIKFPNFEWTNAAAGRKTRSIRDDLFIWRHYFGVRIGRYYFNDAAAAAGCISCIGHSFYCWNIYFMADRSEDAAHTVNQPLT